VSSRSGQALLHAVAFVGGLLNVFGIPAIFLASSGHGLAAGVEYIAGFFFWLWLFSATR
jgi:hypothetical protein